MSKNNKKIKIILPRAAQRYLPARDFFEFFEAKFLPAKQFLRTLASDKTGALSGHTVVGLLYWSMLMNLRGVSPENQDAVLVRKRKFYKKLAETIFSSVIYFSRTGALPHVASCVCFVAQNNFKFAVEFSKLIFVWLRVYQLCQNANTWLSMAFMYFIYIFVAFVKNVKVPDEIFIALHNLFELKFKYVYENKKNLFNIKFKNAVWRTSDLAFDEENRARSVITLFGLFVAFFAEFCFAVKMSFNISKYFDTTAPQTAGGSGELVSNAANKFGSGEVAVTVNNSGAQNIMNLAEFIEEQADICAGKHEEDISDSANNAAETEISFSSVILKGAKIKLPITVEATFNLMLPADIYLSNVFAARRDFNSLFYAIDEAIARQIDESTVDELLDNNQINFQNLKLRQNRYISVESCIKHILVENFCELINPYIGHYFSDSDFPARIAPESCYFDITAQRGNTAIVINDDVVSDAVSYLLENE